MKNDLLTLQEAANFFGVSTVTLLRWEAKGYLVAQIASGNQRMYSKAQLTNLVSALMTGSTINPQPISNKSHSIRPSSPSSQHVSSPALSPVTAGFSMPSGQKKKYAPLLLGMFAMLVIFEGFILAASFAPQWGSDLQNFGGSFSPGDNEKNDLEAQILGVNDREPNYVLRVNVPAIFGKKATFLDAFEIKNRLRVDKQSSLFGGIDTNNSNIDAGTGRLTASNVLYSVLAGSNITITGDPQNPTISANGGVNSIQGQTGAVAFAQGSGIGLNGLQISNTGVLSLQGQTGALNFTPGEGIGVEGFTITNSDPGSAQKIYGTFSVGGTDITAGSNNDTFTFAAGSGITLTPDAGSKTLTITSDAAGVLTGMTSNGVLYATSATTATSTAPGASGFILKSNGPGAAPEWIAPGTVLGFVPFDFITSGTNTTAAMVIGSGASLGYTGTGTINASSLLGNTWVAPGAIGSVTPNSGAFTTLTATTLNGLTITANGSNTLTLAAGKTIVLNNSLTLNGTDGTAFTFPSSSDTLVGRASTDTLTNKTIAAGSNTITGLTNTNLSGTAGITNANLANSSITVTAGTGLSGGGAVALGGSVALNNAGVTSAAGGSGITIDTATGNITITNSGVTSLAGTANQVSVSGGTGAVTLSLPQNIHSAATPTFAGVTLSALTANGGLLYTNGSGTVAQTIVGNLGQCLTSNGGGSPIWSTCAAGANLWQSNNGTVSPFSNTLDLLVGGTSTASAKFAFINNLTGTPTASIAGSVAGYGVSLTGDGVLSTTLNRSLSLNPNGGNVGIGTSTPAYKLDVVGDVNTSANLRTGTTIRLDSAGALSNITGYTQTSGNFAQSGVGTFGTGTGAVSLNGNTSVTGSRTFTVGTGATVLGGTLGVTSDIGSDGMSGLQSQANNFNTVPNSSFEVRSNFTGIVDGWTSSATAGNGTAAITRATDNQSDGSYSIKSVLTGTTSTTNFYMSSLIPVKSSTNYVHTIDVVNDATANSCGNGLYVRVNWQDKFRIFISASDAVFNGATTTTWTNYGGTVTAPSNAVFAQLQYFSDGISSNPNGCTRWFDNAVFRPVAFNGAASFLGTAINLSNNISGTPTASISASSGNNATYLSGDGVLATTNAQTLTLGSASTGNLAFAPGGTTAFTAFTNGRIGIGTSNPLATLDLRGNSGTLPVASFSGQTSNAGLIIDNNGVGDLFTASKSGASKFVIKNNGDIQVNNLSSCPAIVTSASGVLSCGSIGATQNYWQLNAGAVSPFSNTADLLVGGTSTASAKFALYNVNNGTPTASISGASNNALSLTATGILSTTNAQTLTLGSASTGNVILSPGGTQALFALTNGNIGIGTANPLYKFIVEDNSDGLIVASSGETNGEALFYGVSLGVGKFRVEKDGTVQALDLGIVSGSDANGSTRVIHLANTGNGYFNTGGNFGIGTISPTALLDVAGAASVSGSLNFRAGAGAIQTTGKNTLTVGGDTTGDINFKPGNSSTSLFLGSNGNVGIGTTIPTQALSIGNGGVLINRNSGDPYLIFSENDIAVSQIRGTSGGGLKITNSNSATTWATFDSAGKVGIGATSPLATLDVRGQSGTLPIASFSGQTSNAGLIVDNNGVGDLFTASKSGASKFTVKNNGDVQIVNLTTAGGVLYTNGTGTVAQTAQGTSGQCLQSQGVTGAPVWGACDGAGSVNSFTTADGLLYNSNLSTDFAIGGNSSASAKFQVSISGTRPTASVSANTSSAGLIVDNTGVGDLFTASKSGATKFRIDNSGNLTVNGAATFQDGSNSQTAFQVKNAAGQTALGINNTQLTNLIGNPSMEASTSGWFAKGTGTIALEDNKYLYGTKSLKIVTGTVADNGGQYRIPFRASTQYSLSLWMRRDTSTTSTINIGRQDNAVDVDCLTGQTVTTTWAQYTCTFTTGATINDGSNIYVKQTDTTTDTIYVDGVSLVQSSSAQVYTAPADNLQIDGKAANITLNATNSGELQPWQLNTNALPVARNASTTVVANGYIYSLGGSDTGGTHQAEVYYAKLNADGSVGSWITNSNSLPAVRAFGKSVVHNGYIYYIAGSNDRAVYYAKLNSDGSTGVWQTNATSTPVGTGGSGASVVINKGYVYVMGGFTTVYESGAAYAKFNSDGSIGEWTSTTSLPATRSSHVSHAVNGYMYVIGGGNGSASSLVYYSRINADGSLGAWNTNANSLPVARSSNSSIVANGYVYLLGGIEGGSRVATIYYAKFNNDGTIGTWQTSSNSLPAVRSDGGVAFVNGYIYFIGGYNATSSQSTVYYTSTSRVQVGGSLDLIGLSGSNLSDGSGLGGSIYAGNIYSNGSLEIMGNTRLANGLAVLGETNLTGGLNLTGTSGTTPIASISGNTAFAGLVIDNNGLGDLFTASKSGASKFTILNNGNIRVNNLASCTALETDATGLVGCGTDDTGASTNYLQLNNGAVSPFSNTADFLVGGTATASARFSVTGMSGTAGSLGNWSTNTNALPGLRNGHSSVTANGYVYVIGGYNGTTTQSTVYYAKVNADGSLGNWVTNANALPDIRNGHSSVVANGYIYVMGGFDDVALEQTVFYAKLNADGSTGVWQTNANALPATRYLASTAVANGYIYYLGGQNGSGVTQTTIYYSKLNADGSTGAWLTNASNPLPGARDSASTIVANGYVYVIGGYNGTSPQSTVYYARLNTDGSIGAWATNANTLPAVRNGHTSVISNGYVYVMGGYNGSTYQTTVYFAKLNATGSTDAWQTNTNALPLARSAATSVMVNGYVYFMGGFNGSASQSTVYYASTSRVSIAGNLDLIGYTGSSLASASGMMGGGSTGGSIYAGNIFSNGSLEISGNTNLWGGLAVYGNQSLNGNLNVLGANGTAPVASISATTSNAALMVDNNGVGDLFTASKSGKTHFVVKNNGNVGIGTSTPTTALDVNGEIRGTSFSGSGLTDCQDTAGSGSTVEKKLNYNATTKQFSCASDGATALVRKVTDEVVNNTSTFQDDDELNFAVGANETWIFKLTLATNSTNVANIKFLMTTPTGTTCNFNAIGTNASANATDYAAGSCGVSNSWSWSASGISLYEYTGTLTTGGTAGTAQLQWAQNAATAVDTTVYGGQSFLVAYKVSGADVAESYYTKDTSIQAGDVVMADGSIAAGVQKTAKAYDNRAIGIVSTNPGLVLGDSTVPEGKQVLLALNGRVPVKVASDSARIEPGDLLTTSAEPGKAMKAIRPGQVIGKALTSWTPESGADTVLTFINLSYGIPEVALDDSGNMSLDGLPFTIDTLGTINASTSAQVAIVDDQQLSNSTRLIDLETGYSSLSSQLEKLNDRVSSLETLASGSAFLTAAPESFTASSAAELSLDSLDIKNATVSNTLAVLGRTTLSDVGITGRVNIGLLSIDGLDGDGLAAINTSAGDLQLQSNGLNGIAILGGKMTIDTKGNLQTTGAITTKKINIDTQEVAGASLGQAVLKAGQSSVVIETTSVTNASAIFVTPRTKTSLPLSVTSQTAGDSFKVEITSPAPADIKFNWWIVN